MNDIKRVRLFICWSLIFSFLANGCRDEKEDHPDIALAWEGGQATKMIVSRTLLGATPQDSIEPCLWVHLAKPAASRILGHYRVLDDYVEFRPLVAFTPGLKYEVRLRDKSLGLIDVPANVDNAPVVSHAYPGGVVPVPENLLKIYIRFSQPMQEGFSTNSIKFIRGSDTLDNVFLNLNHELWSPDRTMLTLWLDPGRIKRDLQPNQQLGAPLSAGTEFQLSISEWPNAHGVKMISAWQQFYSVSERDTLSPDPANWTIEAPTAPREPVRMNLHESLDYMLLQEALKVVDDQGNVLRGTIKTSPGEKTWEFYAEMDWRPGTYTIEIESRLEDLAGNNLNRLFDNDLSKPQKKNPQDVYKKTFQVR